jgi:hypothetical protein
MMDFGIFRIGEFIYGVLIYSISHSGHDDDDGVGMPSFILCGVN